REPLPGFPQTLPNDTDANHDDTLQRLASESTWFPPRLLSIASPYLFTGTSSAPAILLNPSRAEGGQHTLTTLQVHVRRFSTAYPVKALSGGLGTGMTHMKRTLDCGFYCGGHGMRYLGFTLIGGGASFRDSYMALGE